MSFFFFFLDERAENLSFLSCEKRFPLNYNDLFSIVKNSNQVLAMKPHWLKILIHSITTVSQTSNIDHDCRSKLLILNW